MVKKYTLKTPDPILSQRINYAQELNPEQLAVVKQADGYTLVLAGAGSGKTRTLVYRVHYLLEQGVDPEQILFVTFTNKAAFEMKKRIENLQPGSMRGLWCGTFHHAALRILRMYAKQAGLPASFSILDDEDARDLIRSCYELLPFKPADVNFPKPNVVQRIVSFSRNVCKDVGKILEETHPYLTPFENDIKKIAREYQARKRASGNLDYDDLLEQWIKLLQSDSDIRRRLREKFKYCLVDEYQDTNALQHELMRLLSEHHGNLLVVGDDAQSIYSFRGANVQNILSFPEQHDTKIFKLESNYRSVPPVLDIANDSIQYNVKQFKKRLRAVRAGGAKPLFARLRDTREQATFVAQRIQEYVDEGVDLSEIAVLFRARYQAAELELELSRRRITHILRGGVRFFEQAHIKDILSYLKLMENPRDELSWMRALRQYPHIGHGYARRIYEEVVPAKRELSYVTSAAFGQTLPKRVRTSLTRFKSLMAHLMDPVLQQHPDQLINKILESGYAEYAKSHFENARERIEDLHELVNFAHTYNSVIDFLNDISLRESFKGESIDGNEGAESPLVLTTIHQAKGLEWKVVIILGLSDGQFPHYLSNDDERQLEEERRLFYVALTRAKDDLYMVLPMTRFQYDQGTVINRPSPFITELDERLYEVLEMERPSEELAVELEPNSLSYDEF